MKLRYLLYVSTSRHGYYGNSGRDVLLSSLAFPKDGFEAYVPYMGILHNCLPGEKFCNISHPDAKWWWFVTRQTKDWFLGKTPVWHWVMKGPDKTGASGILKPIGWVVSSIKKKCWVIGSCPSFYRELCPRFAGGTQIDSCRCFSIFQQWRKFKQ